MNRQIAGWVTHRWVKYVVVVGLLAVAVGVGAGFGSKLGEVQENDVASFLPGDAESTEAIARAAQFQDPDELQAIVLFVRESGADASDLRRLASIKTTLAGVDDVTAVQGPVPAQDQQAATLLVTMELDASTGWDRLPELVDELRTTAERDAGGADVYIAGPAAFGADQAEAFAGIDGVLLLAALGVVVVLLLLTYRSPVLWIIPLVAGVASVFTAQGVVYLLAKYADLTVNGQSAGILSVLVLGAGIDYALLLVARYREELHRYEDRHEAMAHALHRAAPAILASGATVVIGLLCLLFAQMNSTSGLGPVGAAGIVIALVMMLVLLPAMLVVAGRWVFWPFIPRYGTPTSAESGVWSRVGGRIARAPRAVWVVTTIALGVCALGTVQLDADGLSNEGSFTTEQQSVVAEKKLQEHFPGGSGDPVVIVSDVEHADQVAAAVGDADGIERGSAEVTARQGDQALVQATLTDAPDSPAAYDAIDRVRDAIDGVDGADAVVGGNTAINKDVQDASAADTLLIIPIILVVVLLILGVLLRSVVAPVVLLGTVVLSFFAALGISALVFEHVFGFEGADASYPLFAFVFLVALGIDYNIFLMTRVREEAVRLGTRRGALVGLAATGGVITSAGLVLAGTFSALGTLPIVFLAELGFTVALGVLLDTIVVRSVLVTALNLDLGHWMWWPSRLWRTEHDRDDRHPTHEAPVTT